MFGAASFMLRVIATILIAIVCKGYIVDEREPIAVRPVGQNTGIWAVKFKPSRDKSYHQIAEQYAIEHDLITKGVVGELEDTYEFLLPIKHQGILHKRALLEEYTNKLMNDHVQWCEHQQILKRVTRTMMFDDPEYDRQWHLV